MYIIDDEDRTWKVVPDYAQGNGDYFYDGEHIWYHSTKHEKRAINMEVRHVSRLRDYWNLFFGPKHYCYWMHPHYTEEARDACNWRSEQ